MQLSEALQKVSKFYVLGTTEFYGKMSEDPWQKAHDDLEGQLLLHKNDPKYFDKMQPAYRKFLSDLEKLTRAYKSISGSTRVEPSIQDCFMIGDEDKLKNLHALASNTCKLCGSKENVRATKHMTMGDSIYCTNCVKP